MSLSARLRGWLGRWRAERLRVAAGGRAAPSDPKPTSTYPQWLTTRIGQRAAEYPLRAEPVSFSILTTVYEKTDVALFIETGQCLKRQSLPFGEWVILAHGPISPELDECLRNFDGQVGIRVFRLPVNLGIAGGMAICLAHATGQYVVPLDADDLLTDDALQVLAAVAAQRRPEFMYSDEDFLVEGIAQSPYWRPDWDPVLNLENSCIWHLCAIRRDVALALRLYSDEGANWCHDWDTVCRVAAAGYQPVHVPEVLYHWRQHVASSTNRPDPESGSTRSVRHVLQRHIDGQPNPQLYETALFPIFRGADEWCIRRRHVEPWSIAEVIFDGAQRGDLAARVAAVTADMVVLRSDDVEPIGSEWSWECMKLFELHPDLMVVSGRVLDHNDRVQSTGKLVENDRVVNDPDVGRRASDPGHFALALKPHRVALPEVDFLIARTGFLQSVLREGSGQIEGLDLRLGRYAHQRGQRIAVTPLVAARRVRDDESAARNGRAPVESGLRAGFDPGSMGAGRFPAMSSCYR